VSISDIDQVMSFSRDSVSQVIILFELHADLDRVANQVREQVSAIRRDLPREAEEPSISRMNLSATPVLTYTLSGPLAPEKLRFYAEDVVKPAVEQVRGVASARVRGGAERQINVLLDLEEIQSRGFTTQQIVDRIRLENLNIPGGDYDEGKRQITVRTVGEFQSLDDLRNVAVGATAEGTIIRLGELARIEDGVKDLD